MFLLNQEKGKNGNHKGEMDYEYKKNFSIIACFCSYTN